MDKLYIGEISSDFHYAQFGNNYIDLFNKESAYNETLTYYRIYTNYQGFYYSVGTRSFGQYNYTNFDNIEVSNEWVYRNDCDKIFVVVFICIIGWVWLLNLFTSVVKRGGLFGGLL